MSKKRGHAINADIFELGHDSLDLDRPFTSFVDVAFRGVTHQVLVAAERNAFTYEHVTGEFSVGEYSGHILETLDAVDAQVSHRYQALVTTPHGVLSTHSYDSVPGLLALVGALRPQATALGVVVEPDADCEFTGPPKVAMTVDVGLVEVTPLTREVIDTLPDWQGTRVDAGELYGSRFADGAGFLTLVTETCRVLVMPDAAANIDDVTDQVAGLNATWLV